MGWPKATPRSGAISAAALARTATRSRRRPHTQPRRPARDHLHARGREARLREADRHPRGRHPVAPRPAQRRPPRQRQVLVVGEVARIGLAVLEHRRLEQPRVVAAPSPAPPTPRPDPPRAGACCAPPAPGRTRTGSACRPAARPAPPAAAASPGRAPARALRGWQPCALTLAGRALRDKTPGLQLRHNSATTPRWAVQLRPPRPHRRGRPGPCQLPTRCVAPVSRQPEIGCRG